MPFDPSHVSNLSLAWTTPSLSLSNNDPVSAWAGAYGTSVALAGSGSTRPLYKTNIQNSLAAVRFDGTDDTLTFTSTGALSAFHLFFVGAFTSVATANRAYIGGSASALVADASTSEYALSSAGVVNLVHGSTAKNTSAHLYEFIYDGAALEFWIDGTLAVSTACTGTFTFSELGSAVGGLVNWYGDIFEVLLYNTSSGAISTNNRNLLRNYEAVRWQTPGYENVVPSFTTRTSSGLLPRYDLVRDFGARGDGYSSDTAAWSAAKAAIESAGGGVLTIPRGRYYRLPLVSADTVWALSDRTIIEATGPGTDPVIDARASTSSSTISLRGSQGTGVTITEDVQNGDREIVCPGLSVSPGQWVKITTREYCLANPADEAQFWFPGLTQGGYRGEMGVALEYDSDTGVLTLRDPIRDPYDATKTKVYPLTMPRFEIGGLSVLRAQSTVAIGIDVFYSYRPRIEGCYVKGAYQNAFMSFWCADGEFVNNKVRENWLISLIVDNNGYGFACNSSKNCLVARCDIRETKHGFTTGGDEPSEAIRFYDNYLESYYTTPAETCAIQTHGNTHSVDIARNTIHRGVSVDVLMDGRIRDNHIIGESQGVLQVAPRKANCQYRITGNTFEIRDPNVEPYIATSQNIGAISTTLIDYSNNTQTGGRQGMLISTPTGTQWTIGSLRMVGNKVRGTATGVPRSLKGGGVSGSTLTIQRMREPPHYGATPIEPGEVNEYEGTVATDAYVTVDESF